MHEIGLCLEANIFDRIMGEQRSGISCIYPSQWVILAHLELATLILDLSNHLSCCLVTSCDFPTALNHESHNEQGTHDAEIHQKLVELGCISERRIIEVLPFAIFGVFTRLF